MSNTIAQQLRTIITELSGEYVERDTTLTNGVLALLARQHHMVIGPIGAAKSAAHEAIVARISGANFFATQMHDAMRSDELFGQIDMPTYDRDGRWVRNTTSYLPWAHLAMIDEIDKGQHLLRSLLRVANERRWRNGDSEIDLPLITMVASANEALGESLAPVWDRFLLRETVSYIEEPANFMAMLAGQGRTAEPTTVALADLHVASTLAVPSITVGDRTFEALYDLRSDLRGEGIVASDRRWKDSIRLLQARAFLSGRGAVIDRDLIVLKHVLWSHPEQIASLTTTLLPYVNTDAQKLASVMGALADITARLEALEGQSRSARTQATADLAEKLSRHRTELIAASAVEDEALDGDFAKAQRTWVRAKMRLNEVCAGMPQARARELAQEAWVGR